MKATRCTPPASPQTPEQRYQRRMALGAPNRDTEPRSLELPTRGAYLAGDVTFEQFYESVVREAAVSMQRSALLPRVKQALANGDEHLNTIPLSIWDALAAAERPAIGLGQQSCFAARPARP